MSKNVCVFGGSFDPPTLGHMNVARAVLELTDVDQVWLMPIYKSFDGKQLSTAIDRLNMTIKACEEFDFPGVLACSYEIRNQLALPTAKILDKIKPYVDGNLSFCIGTDQALSIDKWCESDRLLNTYELIIINGRNKQLVTAGDFDGYRREHVILEKPDYVPNVSSTVARKDVTEKGTTTIVDDSVLKYILENKLYVKHQ